MITTVTTSGTPQPLGEPVSARAFFIVALSSNTGKVFIDHVPQSPVPLVADVADDRLLYDGPDAATESGLPLAATEFVELPGPRLDTWWIDAAVSGEGVAIVPLP